jgi:hypothetical protein
MSKEIDIMPEQQEVAQCPCCSQESETYDHLFFCRGLQNKRASLNHYIRSSSAHTNLHKSQEIFQHCIIQWLKGTQPTQPEHNFFHLREPIDDAIRSQHQIGWNNVFRGFISTKWTDAFSISHWPNAPTDHEAGLQRTTSSIYNLAQYAEQIWQERNAILHQQQDEQGKQMAHNVQTTTIDFLYTQADEVLAGDRHLFHRPRLRTQMLSHSSKRRWIRAVRHALRRAKDLRTSGQTMLTQYFSTLPSPTGSHP